MSTSLLLLYIQGYKIIKHWHEGSLNTSFGITAGLGHKLAIEYKDFSPRSKETNYADITTFNTKLTIKEYNVLYKLNKNISVFTGVAQVKGTQAISGNADTDGGSASTQNKNIWQLGLVGTAPIAEKTTAFAATAVGSNLIAYKLGVSYEIVRNVGMDVYYSYNQYKNLQWESDNGQSDFTAKGLGYGITYRF